jgi:DNA-binding transcriptional regulator YiaG
MKKPYKPRPRWPDLKPYAVERRCWLSMNRRCESDPRYNGRGITVCERWRDRTENDRAQFENFLADMGEKPSPYHSIDRIDNDGNYEPSNCRWATIAQQSSNRRKRGPRMPRRTKPPKHADKSLAIAIRKARERLNESQEQFGRRIGITQATVSRWEDWGPSGGPSKFIARQILDEIDRVHPINRK